jgi:hypothetical protein
MPFLWEQIVDLTYKPSFDVIRVEEAVSCLKLFFIRFVLSSGHGYIVLTMRSNTVLI